MLLVNDVSLIPYYTWYVVKNNERNVSAATYLMHEEAVCDY